MPQTKIDRRSLPEGASFTMKPAKDGWPLRVFDWPLSGQPVRGSILFQTGRGDFIEKYLETLAHFHAGQSAALIGAARRGQGASWTIRMSAMSKISRCGPKT
jgi:lysophospholipase